MILPEFLVPDIPVQYKGYSPKNYDEKFSGLVRMEDALSQSLNIPFINLLQRLGIEKWIGVLGSMGVTSLNPNPGHYGLSSIVGGIELTPLELASLYLTLANDGEYRPLRLLADQDPSLSNRIFSPGATYLTRRALSRRDRPDFPERRRMSGLPPQIHWKTGTSYGHRDAWAAGSGPAITAVVWLGNFDNRGSKDLVGSETAGPLLFDVLEALADRSAPEPADRRPSQLHPIKVCAYSGYPASPACPQSAMALALEQHVPTSRCPYHLRLDIDKKTGLALTPACRAGKEFSEETFLAWPASIRRYLSREQNRLPSPPALAPGCASFNANLAPSIQHPMAGQTIVLLPGVPLERQEIILEAESQHAAGQLSWFVDGEFLGNAFSDDRLWWKPNAGRHEIVVVDQNGLTDKRTLEVLQGGSIPKP
jgi:penicillin-binding protein 1C